MVQRGLQTLALVAVQITLVGQRVAGIPAAGIPAAGIPVSVEQIVGPP